MSPREQLRRKVTQTRASQGLPPTIEDPATLERAAGVLRLIDNAALPVAATAAKREATPA